MARGSAQPSAEQAQAATQPTAHMAAPMSMIVPQATPSPQSFAAVVDLFTEKREAVMATHLKRHVHLVRFESGLIEFNPDKNAPKDLPGQVGKLLTQWTGQRWVASVVNTAGQTTLHEQELEHAKADPLVKSILDAFPGATIETVRKAEDGA